ncbi:hypothetical protein [Ramlibacter pallidus]|uniref:Lipoprotein n=1 Tax=Ramlibacter pallidus TaxID=2780087 RepID=A0ABR9S7K6_9BURK|nr:hypothetical protein [Ramlibacter pallidus]MBE7369507.1 hypothetical protein [Ramlibacter pallidus]
MQHLVRAAILVLGAASLGGCAVVTVAGAATSLAVTAGSLAVDAAVGTVKITGAAAGLAVDAVLPSNEEK